MSTEVHLIAVGKLKDKNLASIEKEYLKRLQTPALTVHEVKAIADNKEQEAKNVVKKINSICKESKPYVVLLTEKVDRYYDSVDFSEWLHSLINNHQKTIIFVLGGAEGHGKEVIDMAAASGDKFSLSKLTFPHQLARIIFVEQYYRAQTIYKKHPYHN